MRAVTLVPGGAALEARVRSWAAQFLEPHWLARLAWLLPVLTYYIVRDSTANRLQLAAGGIAALGIIMVASRAPVFCLGAVVAFLPFKDFVFAFLYKYGVPGDVLQPAASWKEILILAAALGVWRQSRGRGKRFDYLDWCAVGVIVIGLLYTAFPIAGLQTPMGPRLVGLRINIGFPLVFLIARHMEATERQRTLLLRAVVVAGVIAALSGIIQYFDNSWWADFVLNTVQLPRYLFQVSDATFSFPVAFDASRPGGVTRFGPFLANSLVLPSVIAAHYIARRAPSPWWLVACGTTVLATVLTASRGGAVATAIGMVLTFRRGGGSERARVRFGLLGAGLAILALPFLLNTSLAARVRGEQTGSESTTGHVEQLQKSAALLWRFPLGFGLGTGASSGRFDNQVTHVSESAYFQVGNEIGALPMVLVITMVIGLLRTRPRRRGGGADDSIEEIRAGPDGRPLPVPLTTAVMFSAGWAIGLLAIIFNVWVDLASALAFWTIAGLGMAVRDERRLAPAEEVV